MVMNDWRLVRIGATVALPGMIAGCTAIGTGHNTIILAKSIAGSTYPGHEFEELITSGPQTIIPGKGSPESEMTRWNAYRTRSLGVGPNAASIDITVRDQGATPPLDVPNYQLNNASDIAKIVSDGTTSADVKDAALAALRDQYRAMPESYPALVQRTEDRLWPAGSAAATLARATAANPGTRRLFVYHYFPKVTLDLSGELMGAATLDRFDFLAVSVRLIGRPEVRFNNFSPKLADLFDYTLGSLKQTASATGSANVGSGSSNTTSNTSAPTDTTSVEQAIGGTGTLGASLSFSLSDELTRDLKASLDTRSAGILDNGRVFIIALRSNEQKRIAGTYTYEVMLDVPSDVSRATVGGGASTYVYSTPIEPRVEAAVRIVGMVRHVDHRGKTGTFKRVPEPQNDDTFEQVLLTEKTVTLWEMLQAPSSYLAGEVTNLVVYSNESAATWTVYDAKHGVLSRGGGRETHLLVAPGSVTVEFDPINATNVLRAPKQRPVTVPATGQPEVAVVGQYVAQMKGEK